MAERYVRNVEVGGSNPLTSTKVNKFEPGGVVVGDSALRSLPPTKVAKFEPSPTEVAAVFVV